MGRISNKTRLGGNTMTKFEVLAVRSPENIKGVYTKEKDINNMFANIRRNKSIPYRTFSKCDIDEASLWAGVNTSGVNSNQLQGKNTNIHKDAGEKHITSQINSDLKY